MPGVSWYPTQVFGTSFAPQELSVAGRGGQVAQVAPNTGLKEQGVDPPNIELLSKYSNSQGNKNGAKSK